MPSADQSRLQIEFAGSTDLGLNRANNEDAWWAGSLAGDMEAPLSKLEGEISVADGAFMAVCDGLGGANAGEVASRMALVFTQSALVAGRGDGNLSLKVGRDALFAANKAIVGAARANSMWLGMGATVSFIWAEADGAMLGQVGDSRIYRFRRGKLQELSEDHSPVGRLRQSGKLSEIEARQHPSRHVIDQCIGGGDSALAPDCRAVDLLRGDVLLLCTDGLTDGVSDAILAHRLSAVAQGECTMAEAVADLIGIGNDLSGRDNITLILAQVR